MALATLRAVPVRNGPASITEAWSRTGKSADYNTLERSSGREMGCQRGIAAWNNRSVPVERTMIRRSDHAYGQGCTALTESVPLRATVP
jgi:hypothetical protein